MILRHCRNCGEPMRRVAGEDEEMRCVACAPREVRRARPAPAAEAPPSEAIVRPADDVDPSLRVARRAYETAKLLASLTPGELGVHEGEVRTLADMAGGNVAVLRRAMKMVLTQKDPTATTIASSLLLHAYEIAAGLRLR